MKILIVKTSSLGDIIQSLPVLEYLHLQFPDAQIDWVVEKHLSKVVRDHPLISKVIEVPLQALKKNLKLQSWKNLFASVTELRKEKYDAVFDLQGNTKSAVFTMFSRGKVKVGFSLSSVREWPNILVTNRRFACKEDGNIRIKHLSLMQQFFKGMPLEAFLSKTEESAFRMQSVMVCPGSKWKNKQLSQETLQGFLCFIGETWNPHFVFVWGSSDEKKTCEELQVHVKDGVVLEERLEISCLKERMDEMDLVIAVDSSMLHLCGTTKTPSFSIFGPTRAEVFKPLGERHYAFQGKCPYGKHFVKQCPILRECATGACMKEISTKDLINAFQKGIDVAKPGLPVDAL